ncbi:ABC transporter substrate-binding protein [Rhodococcus erythropolis]|uniref:ABC transporter substrate-binding protein n=1 Tax=Rhodococcus baikonurensis TaxID=172041 RepID=UPI002639BA8B|nr:ABC transporter substrate-binding protein [uncultured Rhodococcus sp.]
MLPRTRTLVRSMTFVAATAVAAGSLAACSESSEQVPSIGYAIDNSISTYNANTTAGSVSGAMAAFGRVLPGFTFTGPAGAPVSDTDIGTASELPGDVLTVSYKLNPASVYSDGIPMSCDDLVLTWAASSGKFTKDVDGVVKPMFDTANNLGYADIDRIDCQSGSKDATVFFKPGRSFTDWRSLFGATALMPSHIVTQRAGVGDVVSAVNAGDTEALSKIADFWNTGWNLTPGQVDTSVLPSAGPYRIDSYSADDGLVLVANERWWGNKPATDRIVVWPRGVNLTEDLDKNSIEVVDVASGSAGELGTPSGFDVQQIPSRSIEQFVLATSGALGDEAARRAFAHCVPRTTLFEKFGQTENAPQAGLGSGVVDSRLMAPDSLVYGDAAAVDGDRYANADVEAAKTSLSEANLDQLTVRVGYLAPDPVRAQIVSEAKAACAPAGITIEDASSDSFDPASLQSGGVDAVLSGMAGKVGAGGTASMIDARGALRSGNGANLGTYGNARIDQIIDQLNVDASTSAQLGLSVEAENILWTQVPTIPLFNQLRTVAVAPGMSAVLVNPTRAATGWNMDRWVLRR